MRSSVASHCYLGRQPSAHRLTPLKVLDKKSLTSWNEFSQPYSNRSDTNRCFSGLIHGLILPKYQRESEPSVTKQVCKVRARLTPAVE